LFLLDTFETALASRWRALSIAIQGDDAKHAEWSKKMGVESFVGVRAKEHISWNHGCIEIQVATNKRAIWQLRDFLQPPATLKELVPTLVW